MFNSGYLDIYVSKNMSFRGYFWMLKGVREQKRLGNSGLDKIWNRSASY